MSKKAEEGGERPPSRGRTATRAARHRSESSQREAEAAAAAAAVAAALRDDAAVSSSAAMAARPRRAPSEHVAYRQAGTSEAPMHHHPGGPSHGGIQEVHEPEAPSRPYYVAPTPWQMRRGRPPPEPLPPVAVHEPRYRYERVPGDRRSRIPGPVAAPPLGPRHTGNDVFRPTSTKVERVTTIKLGDGVPAYQGPAPGNGGLSPPPQHHHGHQDQGSTSHAPPGRPQHTRTPRRTPVFLSPDRRSEKRRRPAAICFSLVCILFWLAVVVVGVAVLTVYLVYRPQAPRLLVDSATLNAGYVDELTVPGGPPRGLALNADLTLLAAIYSPNRKMSLVLRSMQLDLYFEGHMIGTQTVLPSPLFERPGAYVLRSVDVVVSEKPLSRQDALAWQNATAAGGPVVLKLAGRFHTQLNFGRWLPYTYWVYPRCTLWMDPPPNGVLLRVHC